MFREHNLFTSFFDEHLVLTVVLAIVHRSINDSLSLSSSLCVCVNVCVFFFAHNLPICIPSFGFLLHNNNIICGDGGGGEYKRDVYECECPCSTLHTYCVMCCVNEMRLGENYFQFVLYTSFCCAEHCLGFLFDCFTYSFR